MYIEVSLFFPEALFILYGTTFCLNTNVFRSVNEKKLIM